MKKVKASPKWGMIMFSAGFLIFSVVYLKIFVADSLFRYYQTSDWTPVRAELIALQLHEYEGDDSDSYNIKGEYRYWLNGRMYHSTELTISYGSDTDEEYWLQLQQKLITEDAENRLLAWVNPQRPLQSVLERDFRSHWFLHSLGMMLLFTVPGIIGIFYGRAGNTIFEQSED